MTRGAVSSPGRCARRAALAATARARQLKRDFVRALASPEEWSWQRFHAQIRSKGVTLLRELPRFHDAVLVAGCQRSGTTALSRVVAQSEGMVDYWSMSDDELEAALILCGVQAQVSTGRYCFQTTYLNESYREYLDGSLEYRLVWVLRNPYSVTFSMLYNWDAFAFDELFDACGRPLLGGKAASGAGRRGLSRLRRACLSYAGKQMQALELSARLGNRMLVVEYDEMVRDPALILPAIYEFIDLPYAPRYAAKLHGRSLSKAELLSAGERRIIEETCMPLYERVNSLSIRP
jgi:hypothetical protein